MARFARKIGILRTGTGSFSTYGRVIFIISQNEKRPQPGGLIVLFVRLFLNPIIVLSYGYTYVFPLGVLECLILPVTDLVANGLQ